MIKSMVNFLVVLLFHLPLLGQNNMQDNSFLTGDILQPSKRGSNGYCLKTGSYYNGDSLENFNDFIDSLLYFTDSNGVGDSIYHYKFDTLSGQLFLQYKNLFLNDINGNPILNTNLLFNGVTWDTNSIRIWQYDNDNRLILRESYYRVLPNQPLRGFIKNQWSYTSFDSLISYTEYNYIDSLREWIPSNKISNTFNSNRRVIQRLFENWNPYDSLWRDSKKEEYFFNNNDQLIHNINLTYNGSWLPTDKYLYYYDSTGRVDLRKEILWNSRATQEWDTIRDFFYTYHQNDSIDTLMVYEYNFIDFSWHPLYFRHYEFDSLNNKIFEEFQYYASQSQSFVPYSRKYYYYTGQKYLGQYEQIFDGAWRNDYKLIVGYDTNDNLIYREWYRNYNNSTVWWESGRENFYYDACSLNSNLAEKNSNNNFSVYPNPATSFLNIVSENINPAKVSVFDLTGKKVFSSKTHDNYSRLDISSLPSGIYFLNIINSSEAATVRFIKN
jgi:hypothetical protein